MKLINISYAVYWFAMFYTKLSHDAIKWLEQNCNWKQFLIFLRVSLTARAFDLYDDSSWTPSAFYDRKTTTTTTTTTATTTATRNKNKNQS